MANEVKAGQIWRDVDPRFERYVRVTGISDSKLRVYIVKVTRVDGVWTPFPRAPNTVADAKRFNGKRGGYELVEDLPQTPVAS